MNVGRKATKASRLIKSSAMTISSIEVFKFFTLEQSITLLPSMKWY